MAALAAGLAGGGGGVPRASLLDFAARFRELGQWRNAVHALIGAPRPAPPRPALLWCV